MKCNTTRIRGRELLDLKRELYKEVKVNMNGILKDREIMAGCRAQWMLLVAYARKGHGKITIMRLLEEIEQMLPGLIEDREAEVMDEMLIRDLE